MDFDKLNNSFVMLFGASNIRQIAKLRIKIRRYKSDELLQCKKSEKNLKFIPQATYCLRKLYANLKLIFNNRVTLDTNIKT